jgi:hypothetical protein
VKFRGDSLWLKINRIADREMAMIIRLCRIAKLPDNFDRNCDKFA